VALKDFVNETNGVQENKVTENQKHARFGRNIPDFETKSWQPNNHHSPMGVMVLLSDSQRK
jgi:hypothetical protein